MPDELTVLAVDDDADFLETLSKMVPEGIRLLKASDAEEARSKVGDCGVDIVFMDVMLPDEEGFELCRAFKNEFVLRPMQVVLMSGLFEGDTLDKARDAGADDFIKKPFDTLELRLRLKAATIRLDSQRKLLEEREFYRKAVRQEEDLSSQLLDEYINLKATLHTVSEIKRALEETNRQLENVARYDSLSGLLNRASLFDRIDFEIHRAVSQETPLVGLMLDIDKFKNINDSYGHAAGDAVIREIGKRLRDHLRKNDFAGRYGGDEFFMLFPDSGIDRALVIAERIRAGIVGQKVTADGSEIEISASIGVAAYQPGDSAVQLVKNADAAMYRAKNLGRNRVEKCW